MVSCSECRMYFIFFNEGRKNPTPVAFLMTAEQVCIIHAAKRRKPLDLLRTFLQNPFFSIFPKLLVSITQLGVLLPNYFTATESLRGLNVPHTPYGVLNPYLNTTTNMTFIYCVGEKMVQPDVWGQEEGKWMLCGETLFFISLCGSWGWMAVNWLLKAAKKKSLTCWCSCTGNLI